MTSFNYTNISHNLVETSFHEFVRVVPFAWDLFFIFIGIYILIKSESLPRFGVYLLGVWVLFGTVFSLVTLNIIGVLCAFIFAGIFVHRFGVKKQWW